jgi:hypothetical protein
MEKLQKSIIVHLSQNASLISADYKRVKVTHEAYNTDS